MYVSNLLGQLLVSNFFAIQANSKFVNISNFEYSKLFQQGIIT